MLRCRDKANTEFKGKGFEVNTYYSKRAKLSGLGYKTHHIHTRYKQAFKTSLLLV